MSLLPESSSFSDFGGEKTDYSAVVDASTDRSAAEVNGVFCDVAMMSRTAVRFWCRITLGSSPTLVSWDATWKGSTSTDPIISYLGTGRIQITTPGTVLDELGNEHDVSFTSVQACLEGGTFGFVTGKASHSFIILVDYANTSGTLSDFSSSTAVNVWAI